MKIACGLCLIAGVCSGAEFHVSPSGSDTAAGDARAPFATLGRAIAASRAHGGTNVISLAAGTHVLGETLRLDARDSHLTIRAAEPGRAIVTGGTRLSGWVREDDRLWSVPLPDVAAGRWYFRALTVDGAFAPRACYPGGTNRLENLGDWKLPLLPALAGHWARKPTTAELTAMPYKPGDLPDTLDFASAEFRLYHMWSESLSAVASNDLRRHVVHLATPAAWPMGACGRRQYEVYNVREGMTEPGRWYLDRGKGRLFYWPKPGEDLARVAVEAPRLEQLVVVKGTEKARVEGLAITGVVFQSTTPPMVRAGFGGSGVPSALEFALTANCVLSGVEIRNVGGGGLACSQASRVTVSACRIHHVGARGLGVSGDDSLVENCEVAHVGLLFPSSCGMGASGNRTTVRNCEIFDVPYSGIIGGGADMVYEGNRIHHVMRVLHDGAAIYGNLIRATIRGNVVHDIVPNGKGFGASAYYCDEGATDCVVERNVAYGVARPVHNHMTRAIHVRDNVFLSDGDMKISFQNSAGGSFTGNTCVPGGAFEVTCPEGVPTWTDNRIFRTARDGRREIGNFAPVARPLKLRPPLAAPRIGAAPDRDGEFAANEWPGDWTTLNRDARRFFLGGAASFVRAAWDPTALHIGVLVTNFKTMTYTGGATWGADDGVEVTVNGKRVRGFACGRRETDLANVRAYCGARKGAKPWDWSKRLVYEISIPFSDLGLTPAAGLAIPFNVQVHGAAYGEDRWFEAPLPQPDGTPAAPRLVLQ
ncbi:MAG: right-handed parallel beta-helix repeat-containing protein [Kiritimatiellia bacterium]